MTFLAAALCGSGALAQPRIEWTGGTYHNFGAFNEDTGPVTAVFTYRNCGTEPLIITGTRTSCGCTVAAYSREALPPDSCARLEVTFDPTGRLGRFEKTVTVDTNTEPRRSRLSIKGIIVGSPASVAVQYPVDAGALALQQPMALAGTVTKGKLKTVFVNAYNRTTDTISPSIGPLPRHIRVSLEPHDIPPGEQASFIVYFDSRTCPVWGLSETPVTITTHRDSATFTLPVIATVMEDFSNLSEKDLARAPIISLPEASELLLPAAQTRNGQWHMAFNIRNTGRSVLELRRLSSPNPAVTDISPERTSIKPGKSIRVNITVTPAPEAEEVFSAPLTIISNDPANPVTSCHIRAILK